jgi:lysophospholipase L1-like esterase
VPFQPYFAAKIVDMELTLVLVVKIINQEFTSMKTTKLFIFFLSLVVVKSLWAQITIMPLGDSITRGSQSTGVNGYRRGLKDLLVSSGYDVNFVGSLQDGTFVDKQHEGWSGFTVKQIRDNVYRYLTNHPAQIILLHIGTNSISDNPSYTTPDEVASLLDEIDRYSETAIVILAEIINRNGYVCPNPSTTRTFNNNVRAMALNRINDPVQPDRIVIVDMECSAGLNYNTDMADNVHPNDNGYGKLAEKWFADGLLKVLPQADAGADQNVDEKTLVTLDGSGSDDPDGTYLYYWWQQLSAGTTVTLSDPTTKKPTFTAPAVGSNGERLAFELTVTDTDGFEHSDTVFVDINNVLLAPVADAGIDHVIAPGITVTLNGSNSYDPDGTISSVLWEQISGATQVDLTTPNELMTEFTTPAAEGEELTFKLTVKDNDNLASSDTVTITVNTPEAPVADAGSDQSVMEGGTVTLNGLNSYDPDGTIASVQWEQLSGDPLVNLSTPTDLTTELTAPAIDTGAAVLTFKLTVKDNDNLVSEDTVNVTVTPAVVSAASSNGGGSGGGGCFIQSVMN